MKIGLVTIHRSNNYGAVLQTYASIKTLSKFADVTLVDYRNSHIAKELSLFRFEVSRHGIMMFAHDILRARSKLKSLKKFKGFFAKEYKETAPLDFSQLAKGAVGDFDVYVCGSDQIWNPSIVSPAGEVDPMFFLDFAPAGARKISLASSIGHHRFAGEDVQLVQNLLSDFSFISTRELDGQSHLQSFISNQEVHQILDPTLLLNGDDWLNFSREGSSKKKYLFEGSPYLLVYSVPRTPMIREVAAYFSKLLDLPIVEISQHFRPVADCSHHVSDAGPYDFVRLISNAHFVVSDSFHGVCFSVNMNIPFLAVSAGARANRIKSLLSILKMDSRIITELSQLSRINVDECCSQARSILEEERVTALNKLEAALSL